MEFIKALEDEEKRLNELGKKIDADIKILAQERFEKSADWYIKLYEKYEAGPLILRKSGSVKKFRELPADEKMERYVNNIEGFFDYFEKRISFFDDNKIFIKKFRDITTREICSYIDIMAFHCLYAQYPTEVGKRFKEFLSHYSTLNNFEKDLIWRLNRNIYVHVGAPPRHGYLGSLPIEGMRLLTVAKESISRFKKACSEKLIDPAPLVFRVDNLRKLKVKLLNDLKKRWEEGKNDEDKDKYLWYLMLIKGLKI